MIGNPPWGADFEIDTQGYIRAKFEVAKTPAMDSYAVFIEAGFRLLAIDGLLGFITPDTFLRKNDLLPIRSFLLNETAIQELIETGPVFSQVRDTWCLVSIVSKSRISNNVICHRKLSRFITAAEERLDLFGCQSWFIESEISQSVWKNKPDLIIGYLASEKEQMLINKIETWPAIGLQNVRYKISRGDEGSKFNIKPDNNGNFFMVIPQNIERYFVGEGIKVNEDFLTPTKVESLYKHSKVWIIRIQKMRWRQRIVCAYDGRHNSAAMKTLQVIVSPSDDDLSLKYLSAILSSKLINFWCVNYLADDMNQSYLSRIPIRPIDFTNPSDAAHHARMVALVERMLALHQKLADAQAPAEKSILQRQIEATDKEIDALVYQLYGLTEEEIRLVEA